MHTRSKEDILWQEVKSKVRERDNYLCQCCLCLTASEKSSQKKLANPSMLKPTDCAHAADATFSIHPETRYDPNKIFFLCRHCHNSIDTHHSPVDGSLFIRNEGLNQEYYWWWRIKHRKTDKYNSNINYEDLYQQEKASKQDINSIEDLLRECL